MTQNENKCIKVDNTYDISAQKPNVYLDNAATTPLDKRVMDKMNEISCEYGNPHSRTHAFGWHAESLIEWSRVEIAETIGADAHDIVFTSGATESNNLAIKGAAMFYKNNGKKHIITANIEHKCVLESCRYLEGIGFDVTYLNPDKDGIISPDAIKDAIRNDTVLVSISAVQNEIGVIQDIEEIGVITRNHGVLLHTDCAQAFGKIPLNVDQMNIDLMSISGHKIYGPKGVGALYVRRKPRVRLQPLISGGGQERGLRSGTLPTMIIVGFGEAARLCRQDYDKDSKRILEMHNRLKSGIMSLDHIFLNGHPIKRYHGILNFSFSFIEGESLIMAIKDLAVSSGSACTSSSLEPSYVLAALGIREDLANSSVRFSVGRFTSMDDIEFAINLVRSAVERLRELSPLWEMFNAGIDLNTVKWHDH